MTQTTLFAAARHSDPQESHDAAATTNVPLSHQLVRAAFREYGALDDRKLAYYTRHAISESRARGARKEIEVCGTIGSPPRRVWRLKG